MIELQKIRFRNFLSYGNYWTEIPLNTAKLNIVVGENGLGKTAAILETVTFALFGKPYRKINKPRLVNSINEKGLLTEIEFVTKESGKDKQYMIRRGIKPNVFEIFVNGKKLDEKDKTRDQQKYLEENILKANYRTFTQIVILGSNLYIPFMNLPPAQRREFIENLLDIGIFSTMHRLLKERNSVLKQLNQRNETSIETTSQVIEVQKNLIDRLEKQKSTEVENIDQDIRNLRIEQDTLKEQLETIDSKINELTESALNTSKLKKLQTTKSKGDEIIYEVKSAIKSLEKETKFMREHTNCPTCHQFIEESHRDTFVTDKQKDIEIKTEILNEAKRRDKNVQQRIEELEAVRTEYEDLVREKKIVVRDIERLTNDMEKLKEKKTGVNEDDLRTETEKLSELQAKMKTLREEQEFLEHKRELYDVAFDMLKDGGIKARIISQYIPIINKTINQYLDMMNFSVSFTLDENFNEEIKSRYRDTFTYDSFSEGEKQRIDIALLQTWRSIAELKNSMSTNILLLDEIFDSSLDNNGMEDYLKILSGVSNNNNVYIISHKIDNTDAFDRVIRIEKHNDFSYVELGA